MQRVVEWIARQLTVAAGRLWGWIGDPKRAGERVKASPTGVDLNWPVDRSGPRLRQLQAPLLGHGGGRRVAWMRYTRGVCVRGRWRRREARVGHVGLGPRGERVQPASG